MLGGAAWDYSTTRNFQARASRFDGKVIEMERRASSEGADTWSPVVEFVADDGVRVTFDSRTSSYPPAYFVGEKVTVLFVPGDRPRIDGFHDLWFFPTFLCGLGLTFIGMCAPWLLAERRRTALRRELRARGRKVLADHAGVEVDDSHTYNNRPAYRLLATWLEPATGQEHRFRSDRIWFDPARYLYLPKVAVYIDPLDPGRHDVDISFLPDICSVEPDPYR
jgi:hypothetical protein